jgi:hypothetical protein
MATLTYFYPDQYRRSDPNPKFEWEWAAAYTPLNMQGVLALYDDYNRPLAMFWVSYGDWDDGLKTRLQNEFKRKAHHDATGMYSWSDLDKSATMSYLDSRNLTASRFYGEESL